MNNQRNILNLDLNIVFDISCRVSFTIDIVCTRYLVLSGEWIPFDMTAFRQENGLWIFFILILSEAIMTSYLGQALLKGYINN